MALPEKIPWGIGMMECWNNGSKEMSSFSNMRSEGNTSDEDAIRS